MDAMSIAGLILVGLVALAAGVYLFKPEKIRVREGAAEPEPPPKNSQQH